MEAKWYVTVTHESAPQVAPGVYGETTSWTTVEYMGRASAGSPDADCPNWVVDDTGDEPVWYNSDLPHEATPPSNDPGDDPREGGDDATELGKVGLALVWKVGLERA